MGNKIFKHRNHSSSSSAIPGGDRSKKIDKELERLRKKDNRIVKLLLLGPSESGKSTFVKQMKIIHMQGFNEQDLRIFKQLIYSNILEGLKLLLSAMENMKIKIDDEKLQRDILSFNGFYCNGIHGEFSTTVGSTVDRLWKHPIVQKCYKRRNEFYLPDSTKYYLDSLSRISADNYKPTNEDVLRSRVATTGIVEIEFPYKRVTLKVIDVGGQRSQRRKWIHVFDNVTALLFIAAISDYDLVLSEDSHVNRMQDCLELFRNIIRNPCFSSTSVILFLNKKDVFSEKLRYSPLTVAFPDYKGSQNFDEASTYISEEFLKRKPHGKTIYTHLTNATNTKNIDTVFETSVDIIVTANIQEAGLQ